MGATRAGDAILEQLEVVLEPIPRRLDVLEPHRKVWRASSCAKWPAPNVTTRMTIARLTGAELAQKVRTAIKSHSKSPASDAVCQNSMPCEALTSVKRIESNGKK